MKNLFLILSLSFFCSPLAYSQFSLGISGGLNLSHSPFNDMVVFNTGYRSAYFLGVTPKYHLNSHLAILSDIEYSVKGFESKGNNIQLDSESRYTYLDFSPEITYHLADFLSLGMGGYIGFKLDEEQRIAGGEWSSTKDLEFIKSTDFGLVGSIRGNLHNFFLVMSYQHGLQDISNLQYTDPNGEPLTSGKQRNRNIQLGIGYFIEIN